MDRTKDLRNRGDKTVLVKKSDVDVSPDVVKNYTKVEPMEPCVERYCELYSKDLSERLGLEHDFLEPSLTNSVLLNPMFGLEKRVVSSGLMTHRQYSRARSSEYSKCRTIILFSDVHATNFCTLCLRSNS